MTGSRATVVVTTRDRPALARRAVGSALAQTLPDVEVVVVDDGSSPAFELPAPHGRVVVVRHESSRGVCAARNAGLRAASGEWVTFLDDDDELAPEMLERSIAAAEASSLPAPVAVLSAVALVDPAGEVVATLAPPPALPRGKDSFLEGDGGSGRGANSLVAPTDVVRAIGGFDEALELFEHDDFGLRLNAVASIAGIADPLYRMTAHAAPRASQRTDAIPAAMAATLAKHASAFARHRRAHARFLGRIAYYEVEAGHWSDAVRWGARAVRRDPVDSRVRFYLATALAGPHALRAYRRLDPPESTVPFAALTRSRARKLARRLWYPVLAVLAAPAHGVTRALLPSRVAPAVAGRPRRALLLCIYRRANEAHIARLVREAESHGWDVRLWALDQAAPALAAHTVGTGPGDKFPLLNALVRGVDLEQVEWLVVTDDDLVFEHGGVDDLLAVAEAARLDFVQPAHTERSHRDLEFTRRRVLSVARHTNFVEIGPLFAVRAPWVTRVAPFPGGHTMGWGLELEWSDLSDDGARLGIVDGVAVRHLGRVGAEYAKPEQRARLRALLAARGLDDIPRMQRTLGVWRSWQRAPGGSATRTAGPRE